MLDDLDAWCNAQIQGDVAISPSNQSLASKFAKHFRFTVSKRKVVSKKKPKERVTHVKPSLGNVIASKALKEEQPFKKLNLVLDIDHTILNSCIVNGLTVQEGLLTDDRDNINLNFAINNFYFDEFGKPELFAAKVANRTYLMKLRRGLREFLATLNAQYDIHVYTKADGEYMNFVLNEIDPDRSIVKQMITKSLTDSDSSVKDLQALLPGVERGTVIIVDDRREVWSPQCHSLLYPALKYAWTEKNLRHLKSGLLPPDNDLFLYRLLLFSLDVLNSTIFLEVDLKFVKYQYVVIS